MLPFITEAAVVNDNTTTIRTYDKNILSIMWTNFNSQAQFYVRAMKYVLSFGFRTVGNDLLLDGLRHFDIVTRLH